MKKWIIILVILVLVGAGGYFAVKNTALGRSLFARASGTQGTVQSIGEAAATQAATVQIQPASAIVSEVSASGNIELLEQTSVAIAVDGIVNQVNVNVGDVVTAGQVLVAINTTDLERAVSRAQIAVDTQVNNSTQTTMPPTAAEIAAAEAKLASAQAALEDAKTPPSDNEIAAAKSSVAAAWANYNDLLAGPSQDELTQLSADLKKAEVALAEAQRAYDKVAWRNESGMTSESADLQDATITYESAKAAYQQTTAAASTGDLQSAISTARSAQQNLDDLLKGPNAADIASAEANVADAQNALDDLQNGADETEMKAAELSLKSALIDLEEARNDLAQAQVTSPISGTVLSVSAAVGERVSSGTTVVTLADPRQLKLTINVAEVDISQIERDQPAQITIDAFPGKTFMGKVAYIAPSSSATSGLIEYPVTVLLTDHDLDDVRAGMTSVATIANTNTVVENGWFVPTNALKTEGEDAVVTVVRNNASVPVKVTPGNVQGEWTLVQSAELQDSDQVVGSVTTKIQENQGGFGPPGGGLGGGGGVRTGGQNRP